MTDRIAASNNASLTRRRTCAGVMALGLTVMGCGPNTRTVHELLTLPDADKLGPTMQVRIARDFGGVYDDPALHQYLATVMDRVMRGSGYPLRKISITILNTPIVNLFSGPGDRIYVTRGLLALVNSESELAGLLAMEAAHILLGHSLRKYQRDNTPGEGLMEKMPAGADIANLGQFANAPYLRPYTRQEAILADQAAVDYLIEAGYNPTSLITIAQTIIADSAASARLIEEIGGADPYDFQTKHPRTLNEISLMIADADPEELRIATEIGRDDFLARVQGMRMGDDPGLGVADGTAFVHPEGGFAFDVPQGFRLSVGSGVITARGPGDATMMFDVVTPPRVFNLLIYLRDEFARTLPLRELQHIRVNGREGAMGRASIDTPAGPIFVRVAVVMMDASRMARFMFVLPSNTADSLSLAVDRTLFSLRDIDFDNAGSYNGEVMRVVRTEIGDTVANLAAAMPYGDMNDDRFRLLNGLPAGAEIGPNQVVKLVVAEDR